MPLLDFMIPSKSKAIRAKDVAKSMFNTSKNYNSGVRIYHYNEIKD
jgi:hypothetical protein